MELLVELIFIVSFCKYCLKAALSGSLWLMAGYAIFAALYAMLLYPVVIEQPTTIIHDLLSTKATVSDIALLTTTEALVGIFVSIYLLENYFKPKDERTKLAFVAKVIPGVLILCSIPYFELLFFKFRVGGDFLTSAIYYSTILGCTVFFVGFFMRKVVRGESLKLEIKVLLNLMILVGGLLVSSSVADYNTSHSQTTIEWGALITLIVGGVTLIALGVWLQRISIKQIFKIQKWNR